MFSSNFLCTDKTPRFPSTREVGSRYLTIIVFRLSTLLRLVSLKRIRTKKKDLSIDDASWREETMIGWVVRLDGSGGWIARLGFHPTPSFSTPSPATRVVPRPIDERVCDFATGRAHRRTKRQTRHEAILHADDWRLISNAYEIYLCKHVRLILWRCDNGGALSRRQSGLREASLPPFCGRGTEKGEKGKKERDSRNKIRARPLFDRCRSRLVIGTARG